MPDHFCRLVSLITRYSHLVRNIDFSLSANQFIRFLVAGSINTIFGFLVFSLSIFVGAEVWLALLACMTFGVVFNFFTTGGYVFRELSFKGFILFIICYIFMYCINLWSIELLSMWLNSKILCQLILTFLLAILSYLILSRYVFTKKRPIELK